MRTLDLTNPRSRTLHLGQQASLAADSPSPPQATTPRASPFPIQRAANSSKMSHIKNYN